MKYAIDLVENRDEALLSRLMEVWESSVRATHHFLTEQDIVSLRPYVMEGFHGVNLSIAREPSGEIVGFSGICESSLEMLFVHAGARGRGAGRALLQHALAQGVTKLDVNEQNPEGRGFYEHCGFTVCGRSATDGMGNPFPLLHMELEAQKSAN